MQPIYFIINQISELDTISALDLMTLVNTAKQLGLHEPKFPPKNEQKRAS
jgi:phenylalanine-4-hydroxylase